MSAFERDCHGRITYLYAPATAAANNPSFTTFVIARVPSALVYEIRGLLLPRILDDQGALHHVRSKHMYLKDRSDAGRRLFPLLEKYRDRDAVVYALPRGGVVLAVEIAAHLNIPLDLVIPRKVGHPLSPEYAIAAVTEHGDIACNEQEVAVLGQSWFVRAGGD